MYSVSGHLAQKHPDLEPGYPQAPDITEGGVCDIKGTIPPKPVSIAQACISNLSAFCWTKEVNDPGASVNITFINRTAKITSVIDGVPAQPRSPSLMTSLFYTGRIASAIFNFSVVEFFSDLLAQESGSVATRDYEKPIFDSSNTDCLNPIINGTGKALIYFPIQFTKGKLENSSLWLTIRFCFLRSLDVRDLLLTYSAQHKIITRSEAAFSQSLIGRSIKIISQSPSVVIASKGLYYLACQAHKVAFLAFEYSYFAMFCLMKKINKKATLEILYDCNLILKYLNYGIFKGFVCNKTTQMNNDISQAYAAIPPLRSLFDGSTRPAK
jgi:hypothetical protein